MNRSFSGCKWMSLVAFAVMYNFVYLGRFNVDNLMARISEDIAITASHQDMISMSVFISYAAGSFINGYIADRAGGKKIVVVGGVMTSLLNMCISVQSSWMAIFIICIMNGYFQSMIWVGGISFLANWWREGERGKGIGIANFFSGMSHATAYVLPIMFMSLWPSLSWRWNFVIPIAILLLFVILFAIFAKESPESCGFDGYDNISSHHQERENKLREIKVSGGRPWMYFFRQEKFWWWCAIAMISSICRYGLLNWIPLYYTSDGEGDILSETFSNLTLPVGMAFGTLIITWIAGTKMFANKGLLVTAMAAICGTLVIVFPMIDDTQSVLVGIFFTGFALYGINGILWVHAIDQGCRVFAGSAAGIFNGFAYFGAYLEGFIFPAILRIFDNYLSIFIVMEALCICMVICGMVVSKKDTMVEPEVRE